MLPAVFLFLVCSCTVPKKYQADKPFVFYTNVKVEGSLSPSAKKDLAAKLANQQDDSMRTQIVSIAGIYNKLVSPPIFDTANVRRSIGFMVALLNSSGYYAGTIKDSIHRDTVRNRKHPERIQYRVSVYFQVWPGKQLKLDSIGYNLQTPALEALALQSRGASLLKKGHPYSKQDVSAELDRLVELFRNHGYYKFSKDDLMAIKDTVVSALIDPNLDPFQQAALLEELKRKREHPTINVSIEQRPVKDSSRIVRYYIGHVTAYPDLPVLEDTVVATTIDTTTMKGFTIISRSDRFKPKIITRNIFLQPGQLYQQTNYNRTLSRFGQMGAWQQASINLMPADSVDTMLNAVVRLYPAKKQNLNVDLEASRNTNDIITASNLFGVGLNLGLRNRNTFQRSILTSTSIRGGVELGDNFIQTTQASLSHSISFPRLIFPNIPFLKQWLFYPRQTQPKRDRLSDEWRLDSFRTVLNANASYTDRRQFFTVRSINGSWGYEWTRGNKSYLWRPINIEYTLLDKTDSFQHYLDSIPSLNLAFRSGLVVGQQFVYSSVKKIENRTRFLRMSAEESGATLGLIKTVNDGALWRFIKGDIEYRYHVDFHRTQLAMRAYGGAGWAYGKNNPTGEEAMPFYKAFFAGGPNSMRGWQVRQLGLGSSKYYDTANGGNLDRFGDIQLEGNMEYRFPLGTILGVKLMSAIYTDVGNIWNRHPIDTAAAYKGSDFKFNRFYNEFAVDAGTGLRLDFDWFVIRLDYAYKIRDPNDPYFSNHWFHNMQVFNGQFQLGIGYPF